MTAICPARILLIAIFDLYLDSLNITWGLVSHFIVEQERDFEPLKQRIEHTKHGRTLPSQAHDQALHGPEERALRTSRVPATTRRFSERVTPSTKP